MKSRLIYEKLSLLILMCSKNGTTSHRSHEMSGFVGLRLSKNQKLEKNILIVCVLTCSRESEDRVVGQGVRIEKRLQKIHNIFLTSLYMKKMVLERSFSAPQETVWEALTHEDALKKWWCPPGLEASYISVDLRNGGIFRYCFRAPDGKEFWGR